MTVLDIVIIAVIAACTIYGARQGLIRELSHIVAFALGIFLAVKLHSTAAHLLFYRLPANTALAAAFLALLLLVLIAVYLAFSYIKSSADKLKLGPADHVAGAVIGALQGALVCSLIIFSLVNFSSTLPSSYLRQSKVASFLLYRSERASGIIPESYVSKFISIFQKQASVDSQYEKLYPSNDVEEKPRSWRDTESEPTSQPEKQPLSSIDPSQYK